MAQISLALQLYTVRDHLAKDLTGTLKKVKDMGYDLVEMPGLLSDDAQQAKELLDDIGLRGVGMHVALNLQEADLDTWIANAKTLGLADIAVPYLPEDRRKTREDWLAFAGLMDGLGARCKAQGMRLSYHNHSFEFVKFDGVYALDLLYENTSPDNVYAEIDTYWVKHGGADPVAYVRNYAGRLPTLHIKDMAPDENRSFAEIGNGILDWEAIHEAALEGGVEYYIVEQDRCAGDSLDSARISHDFVMQNLLAE